MHLPSKALHDLTAAAVRLNAVVNLLRDPEAREELDAEETNRVVLEALDRFREIWNANRNHALGAQPGDLS